MRKPWLASIAAVALIGAMPAVWADHKTVTGEVVDLYTFLRNGFAVEQSAQHDAGAPLGVYDHVSDTLFVIVPNRLGQSSESLLASYFHQDVNVSGYRSSRNGIEIIVPISVEPAKYEHAHDDAEGEHQH